MALKVEISDDGTNWTAVDMRAVPWVADSTAYGSSTSGILRGPFELSGESSGIGTLYTIPVEFFADTTARSTRAPALTSRYFRITPHATWDPRSDQNAFGWQVSEFSLVRDGERHGLG